VATHRQLEVALGLGHAGVAETRELLQDLVAHNLRAGRARHCELVVHACVRACVSQECGAVGMEAGYAGSARGGRQPSGPYIRRWWGRSQDSVQRSRLPRPFPGSLR